MISLFNRIFLEVGLDLCVTPYKVLSTSPNSGAVKSASLSISLSLSISKASLFSFLPVTGFVEYVESRSVASVVSEYGGILKYLDSLATKKKGARSVVADFTKSCGEFWRLAPFLCVRSLPALITFK